MQPAANRLKCRWCDVTVSKWVTGKDGKRKPGWGRLHSHQWARHPDEMEALEEQCGPVEEIDDDE